MQDLVCASGAGSQVVFLGAKTGRELAAQLNEHQILVVPSRWNEPFGIVALEGIACGCVVVGSSGGGLKQAIGPCGLTFPNGNAAALAEVLASLLRHPETRQPYTAKAEAHLQGHRRAVVAHAYLEVLQAATQRGTAFEPQRTKSCEKRLPAAPERGSPESQRVAGAVTAAVLENRAPTGHGRAP
jgi:glycosyltransferase involved in cell wall biosynthesis